MYKRCSFWLMIVIMSMLLAACGTSTDGPVSISTDQDTYNSTTPMKVDVTNNTQTPIYAAGSQVGCSILAMNVQVNNGWQEADVAQCQQDDTHTVVKIDAGQTYSTTIQSIPTGTYRFVLVYSTSPNLS